MGQGTPAKFLKKQEQEENRANPGIGTTSPDYKLDVNGNINATSYRSNGTDYAEWMRKANISESISAGDVIAVVGGRITNPVNLGSGTATYRSVNNTYGMPDPIFKKYRVLHRIGDSCKLCDCIAISTIFRADLLKNQEERPL